MAAQLPQRQAGRTEIFGRAMRAKRVTTPSYQYVKICRYVYPFKNVIMRDLSIPHLFQGEEEL